MDPNGIMPWSLVSTGVPEWYFVGHEAMYLLWPWDLELRFLLPVAPLAGLYAWRGGRRLLENSTLVRDVPDIAVAGIDLFSGGCDGNLVSFSVGDGVFAAPDGPLAPRSDHREIRRKCGVGQLEANLIVAFTGAAVREGIGAYLAGDFDLAAGDERATHRSAEEVFTTVDGAGAEGGPHELFHEFLAQIFDVALIGTRCDRFRTNAFQLISLPNVSRNADDTGVVALFEPGNDYRCIEPTGVGKGNCTDHGRLNKYSELLNI